MVVFYSPSSVQSVCQNYYTTIFPQVKQLIIYYHQCSLVLTCNQIQMNQHQTIQNVQNIKALYQALLQKYYEEAEQIENIDQLYTKFRNLKLYEAEFDKHEELKKQMGFWNNPNLHQKSPRENELEQQLHKILEQNTQLKAQLASANQNYPSEPRFH